MKSSTQTKFKTVDEYISTFPESTRVVLQKFRELIKQSAPFAEEVISYNMPAYKQNGILVYFAANKEHIGFYPTPSPIFVFKNELAQYKTSKGAVQFPINVEMPKELIQKIVAFRIKEDALKKSVKSRMKK